MTTKKKAPINNDNPYETKDRNLMHMLVFKGFYPDNVVNTSKPGDPIIMEWTFPPDVRPLVLQFTRQGSKSIKLDGHTWADIESCQDVFRRNLHSVTHDD